MLHTKLQTRETLRVSALLVLMLALLLGGSDPALARHEGMACGLPSPEDPFGHEEFIDIGHRFLIRNVRIAPHPIDFLP